MKRFFLATLFTTLLITTANAGFNEGVAAYQNKNFSLALKEFMPLAEQGNAKAQVSLAAMYSSGQGVPKDESKAAVWLRKAADQGDATAQWQLGEKYTTGNGVVWDNAQGAKWLLKAAKQGQVNAQLRLGFFYFVGALPKNNIKAANWFRKAAEQGNTAAQSMLGLIYEQGTGVKKNLVIAYALYNLNANIDPRDSLRKGLIEKKMSPKQIQIAKLLTTEMAKPNNLSKTIEAYLKNPAYLKIPA